MRSRVGVWIIKQQVIGLTVASMTLPGLGRLRVAKGPPDRKIDADR